MVQFKIHVSNVSALWFLLTEAHAYYYQISFLFQISIFLTHNAINITHTNWWSYHRINSQIHLYCKYAIKMEIVYFEINIYSLFHIILKFFSYSFLNVYVICSVSLISFKLHQVRDSFGFFITTQIIRYSQHTEYSELGDHFTTRRDRPTEGPSYKCNQLQLTGC